MGNERLRIRRPMHEATRRTLCRLSFVLLAALPVLCTFGLCIAEAIPAYQRARAAHWSKELSQQLGFRVEVGSVEIRSPERLLLHNLRLLHPESQSLVAQVPLIDVIQSPAGFALRVVQPELQAAQVAAAWQLFHDQFLSRPASRNQVAVVVLERLDIRGADGADEQLSKLRFECKWTAFQASVNATLGFTSKADEAPAQLLLSRTHTEGRQATDIKLTTGSAPLPCRLLRHLRPETTGLGADAIFIGSVALRLEPAAWQLRTNGHITSVDTGRFTEPSQIAGQGQIWLEDLVANQVGLQHVHGQLFITQGRISHKLLVAASAYLGVQLAQEVMAAKVSSHPFEQFAIDFDLQPDGMKLTGLLQQSADRLATLPSGTVLSDQVGAIAAKNSGERMALGQVVIALSGSTLPQPIGQAIAADIIQSPIGRHLVSILPPAAIQQAVTSLRAAQLQVNNQAGQ